MASPNKRSVASVDYLALLGLTVTVAAVGFGGAREFGHLSSLLQLSAFLIVFGGTLGAVLLQTPLKDFRLAMRRLAWILWPPVLDYRRLLIELVNWSRRTRREGLLALDAAALTHPDVFIRRGLSLVVDGTRPDTLRASLLVEVDTVHAGEVRAARVFEAMGGYSPTLGIIGAVLGLIHVMQNLSDPEALGAGVAVAFVSTLYGVLFANLLFLPVANKLKALGLRRRHYYDMAIDGLAMIAGGDSPQVVKSKLEGYLH